VCIGNENSAFPFQPRESRANGNGHGVIWKLGMVIATREREGMGIDNCGKIPAQHILLACVVSAQKHEVTTRLDCAVVV